MTVAFLMSASSATFTLTKNNLLKNNQGTLPGGPVVKTPCSQCREHGFDLLVREIRSCIPCNQKIIIIIIRWSYSQYDSVKCGFCLLFTFFFAFILTLLINLFTFHFQLASLDFLRRSHACLYAYCLAQNRKNKQGKMERKGKEKQREKKKDIG